ncbi:MAG: hypothetical protein GY765_19855 [bacterium]|nr:hypothetical protein [bacterium]
MTSIFRWARFFFFFCALFIVTVFCKASNSNSITIYSENGIYCLEVTNHFSVMERYFLLYREGNLIWEIGFLSTMCATYDVSNRGEVAIPSCNQIKFYNKKGKLKGVFPKKPEVIYFRNMNDCSCGTPTLMYAPNGKSLYLFSHEGDRRIVLFSVSNSGKERWRIPLDTMCGESHLDNFGDNAAMQVFTNRIILYGFTCSSAGSNENCFLLEASTGKIISKYHIASHSPIIDRQNKCIILDNEKNINAYSLKTGLPTKTLERDDLIPWLYETNSIKLTFALNA